MSSKRTNEEFVYLAKKAHVDTYDYSKCIYVNSTTPVEIICKIHGSFSVTPLSFLTSKHGCRLCSYVEGGLKTSEWNKAKTLSGIRLKPSLEKGRIFIENAKKVHGDKYDYSLVSYITCNHDVVLICSKHGEFKTNPNMHIIKGYGCSKCAREARKLSKQDFITRAVETHGCKYNYDSVSYFNFDTKVIIGCPVHGDFLQSPCKHLKGSGCPQCKSSQGERVIALWLKNKEIAYESEKKFKGCVNPKTGHGLRFDFYLPEKNVCIEFDGVQHFGNRPSKYLNSPFVIDFPASQYRDKLKDDFCASNGIGLVRIPYTDFKRIPEILQQAIL